MFLFAVGNDGKTHHIFNWLFVGAKCLHFFQQVFPKTSFAIDEACNIFLRLVVGAANHVDIFTWLTRFSKICSAEI